MSETNEPITLEHFTNVKVFSFMGSFLLGIGAAFLSKALIPYVAENPVAMFIIFPMISIPLCLYNISRKPKCKKCGSKTQPAPTPAQSQYDNYKCPSCAQIHRIHSTTRS